MPEQRPEKVPSFCRLPNDGAFGQLADEPWPLDLHGEDVFVYVVIYPPPALAESVGGYVMCYALALS